MKTRFAALVVAVLALCHCSNCPDPDSTQAKVENALSGAGYAWAHATLSVFAGAPPCPAGTACDCRCSGGCGIADPGEAASALWSPPQGTCTATASDGACPACVAEHCCAETLACVADDACTCRMAQETQGTSWPASVSCDAEDATYAAEHACLSDHCAKECLQ